MTKVRFKKLMKKIEDLELRLRITQQQIVGYAETTTERDEYRATVQYYERALYCHDLYPMAVHGGKDAMEIKTEKVVDIIRERDLARSLYQERVREDEEGSGEADMIAPGIELVEMEEWEKDYDPDEEDEGAEADKAEDRRNVRGGE